MKTVANPTKTSKKVSKKYIEEEFRDSDGYWIYLKPGWKNDLDPIGNLHIISEDTKTQAYSCGVLPCDCEECKK
jgi:hypothetical protein